MIRYKNYVNTHMLPYITNRISTMTVKDIYKPLLVDIILRRAHEYNLSEQDIALDLETLVRYVNKIEIADIKDSAGLYCPQINTIKISKRNFEGSQINYEAIYETITHEVYHALARKNMRF